MGIICAPRPARSEAGDCAVLRRRATRLAAVVAGLGLIRLIAYSTGPVRMILARSHGTRAVLDLIQHVANAEPLSWIIATWPFVVALVLWLAPSRPIAQAAAVTLGALALGSGLLLAKGGVADGAAKIFAHRSAMSSAVEVFTIVGGLILAFLAWRLGARSAEDGVSPVEGTRARPYRAIAGRLFRLVAVVFALTVLSGHGWELFTEVLTSSRSARDFVMQLDARFANRPAATRFERESAPERHARLLLNSALEATNSGRDLEARDEYDRAIAAYTQLALDAETSGFYRRTLSLCFNNLAWLLATCPDTKLRDPKRAVELAEQAVRFVPHDGNSWNTLGVAHYRAGEWNSARETLTKSMDLREGGDSFDWYALAMTHAKLGDSAQARRWFDQAVRWNEQARPFDVELHRFRAEAAGLLGLPVPPAPTISDQRRVFTVVPGNPARAKRRISERRPGLAPQS